MNLNLPEAAERFVAVWANPLAASELAAKLTNSEVWSLSDLLTAMGEPGVAAQWLAAHGAELKVWLSWEQVVARNVSATLRMPRVGGRYRVRYDLDADQKPLQPQYFQLECDDTGCRDDSSAKV